MLLAFQTTTLKLDEIAVLNACEGWPCRITTLELPNRFSHLSFRIKVQFVNFLIIDYKENVKAYPFLRKIVKLGFHIECIRNIKLLEFGKLIATMQTIQS